MDATWSYDDSTIPFGVGRVRQQSVPQTYTYNADAYDAQGRPTSERFIIGSQSFPFATTYDMAGAIEMRTLPGSNVLNYEKDSGGFLQRISRGVGTLAYAESLQWGPDGRLNSWSTGNGFSTSYSYDPLTDRLESSEVKNDSAALVDSRSYSYRKDDLIQSIDLSRMASASVTYSYGYDELKRLTSADGPYDDGSATARTLHYDYDLLGNMTCRGGDGPSSCVGGTSMVYPGPNDPGPRHGVMSVDGQAVGYDAAGALVSIGTRSYQYDALGRLTQMADAGNTLVDVQYTADGRSFHTTGSGVNRFRIVPDFEWDQVNGLARIHVRLAEKVVATHEVAFAPGGGGGGGGGGGCAGTLAGAVGGGDQGPGAFLFVQLLVSLVALSLLGAMRGTSAHIPAGRVGRFAVVMTSGAVFLFVSTVPAVSSSSPSRPLHPWESRISTETSWAPPWSSQRTTTATQSTTSGRSVNPLFLWAPPRSTLLSSASRVSDSRRSLGSTTTVLGGTTHGWAGFSSRIQSFQILAAARASTGIRTFETIQ